jgi:hypothetical protein
MDYFTLLVYLLVFISPLIAHLLCPAQDPATAPRARFFSEFGFQGLPSIESLARVSDPRGLSLYSDWFAFRQRYNEAAVPQAAAS